MEENIGSSKEDRSNVEEPLNKSSLIDVEKKSQSNEINKISEEKKLEPIKQNSSNDSEKKINNENVVNQNSNIPKKKPIKAIPIEKKPFSEFINLHLLPSLISEFKERGFEVKEINLKKTARPIEVMNVGLFIAR